MSTLRDSLKRDSILLQHICPWGVRYDSSMGRYGFECRTDGQTFNKARESIQFAGLEFDIACFNSFVASVRGVDSPTVIDWDRNLPGNLILPGEVVLLNAGKPDEMGLLKIASGRYLTVKSENKDLLLSSLSTDASESFAPGCRVVFDAIGSYQVGWIHILPPPRINRTIDYSMSHIYNRTSVSGDISSLVPVVLQPLSTRHFENKFQEIAREFAQCGISSLALRVIVDAYVKKIMK